MSPMTAMVPLMLPQGRRAIAQGVAGGDSDGNKGTGGLRVLPLLGQVLKRIVQLLVGGGRRVPLLRRLVPPARTE